MPIGSSGTGGLAAATGLDEEDARRRPSRRRSRLAESLQVSEEAGCHGPITGHLQIVCLVQREHA